MTNILIYVLIIFFSSELLTSFYCEVIKLTVQLDWTRLISEQIILVLWMTLDDSSEWFIYKPDSCISYECTQEK